MLEETKPLAILLGLNKKQKILLKEIFSEFGYAILTDSIIPLKKDDLIIVYVQQRIEPRLSNIIDTLEEFAARSQIILVVNHGEVGLYRGAYIIPAKLTAIQKILTKKRHVKERQSENQSRRPC